MITVPFRSGKATLTDICAEPEPPAASVPMFQETVPARRVPPPVADTKVVLAGTASAITTPVAPEPPVFEKLIV